MLHIIIIVWSLEEDGVNIQDLCQTSHSIPSNNNPPKFDKNKIIDKAY